MLRCAAELNLRLWSRKPDPNQFPDSALFFFEPREKLRSFFLIRAQKCVKNYLAARMRRTHARSLLFQCAVSLEPLSLPIMIITQLVWHFISLEGVLKPTILGI